MAQSELVNVSVVTDEEVDAMRRRIERLQSLFRKVDDRWYFQAHDYGEEFGSVRVDAHGEQILDGADPLEAPTRMTPLMAADTVIDLGRGGFHCITPTALDRARRSVLESERYRRELVFDALRRNRGDAQVVDRILEAERVLIEAGGAQCS